MSSFESSAYQGSCSVLAYLGNGQLPCGDAGSLTAEAGVNLSCGPATCINALVVAYPSRSMYSTIDSFGQRCVHVRPRQSFRPKKDVGQHNISTDLFKDWLASGWFQGLVVSGNYTREKNKKWFVHPIWHFVHPTLISNSCLRLHSHDFTERTLLVLTYHVSSKTPPACSSGAHCVCGKYVRPNRGFRGCLRHPSSCLSISISVSDPVVKSNVVHHHHPL